MLWTAKMFDNFFSDYKYLGCLVLKDMKLKNVNSEKKKMCKLIIFAYFIILENNYNIFIQDMICIEF